MKIYESIKKKKILTALVVLVLVGLVAFSCSGCESVHIGNEPDPEKGHVWENPKSDDPILGAVGAFVGALTGTGPAASGLLSGLVGLLGGRIWVRKQVSKGILAIENAKVNGIVDFNKVGSEIKDEAGETFNDIYRGVRKTRKHILGK